MERRLEKEGGLEGKLEGKERFGSRLKIIE